MLMRGIHKASLPVCAAGPWVLDGPMNRAAFNSYIETDLNPIEMAFSKLKAHLRAAAARTYDELWKAIGNICDLFMRHECWNFFKAAGYASD